MIEADISIGDLTRLKRLHLVPIEDVAKANILQLEKPKQLECLDLHNVGLFIDEFIHATSQLSM